MLGMTRGEVEVSWRRSLTSEKFYRSRHFWTLAMFSLLNVEGMAGLFHLYRHNPQMYPQLFTAAFVILAILGLGGYYFVGMCRYVSRELEDWGDHAAILRISYIGYKLYALTLGVSAIILMLMQGIVQGR